MVEQVAGGKALPAEVIQQIVAKTDGVPLFVEELTKMVLESGLLAERADHYELQRPSAAAGDSRHAARFAHGAARSVWRRSKQWRSSARPWDGSFPMSCCGPSRCSTTRRLQPRPGRSSSMPSSSTSAASVPHATFIFKHALVQDAAYQSVLKSSRQQSHQRIAQVLEARFAETRDTQPELVGPPLHGGRPRGGGDPLLATGGPARGRALGARGGDQPPRKRTETGRGPSPIPISVSSKRWCC